jgi:hypothetical protein
MTLPATFSNNTSPTGLQLDQTLAAVAAMGLTSGVITGTANALTLTPNANQPTVAAYVNNARFDFTATGNSTLPVTLQINALAPLPVYLPGGVQAGSGSITSGSYYEVVFLQALNSGGGGFQIASAVPAASAVPVAIASSRGLLVTNNGAVPNTKINVTASQAVLTTTSGTPIFVSAPSVVIDLTTTGANGMDVGARPTSGWVYCYLVSTGSVTAGLATITAPSAGNPAMPGGYSYLLYVGAMFCDGSQNLLRSRQLGKRAQYQVTAASNTTGLPQLITGLFGSPTVPTLPPIAIAGFVPLTAGRIALSILFGGSNVAFIVAPNNNYGGLASSSSYTPGAFQINSAASANIQMTIDLVLESAFVYYAASDSGGVLSCLGWEDYFVNA